MEVALRWWCGHSFDDRKRFLVVDVANPSLTLNEVDSFPKLREKQLSYHTIARCSKLPSFTAFDWSKTNESIVALGLGNGNANLVKFGQANDAKPNSEVVAAFKIKQQRKCNSVAFNTQDWLALAVDKTRSDVCLFVFDTNRTGEASADPVRKLCAAELVSSVRFFPGRPQEIVAGVQRAFVRIYDLRDGFSGSTNGAQAATRNVNNISVDPLDENYFASGGSTDDPSVTVWDRRWIAAGSVSTTSSTSSNSNTGAVFEFKPAVDNSVKTTVWSLRYSGQLRGRLAICSSNGELKVLDTVEGPTPNAHNSFHLDSFSGSGLGSYHRYVTETRTLESPYHDPQRGRELTDRIVAYDWVNSTVKNAQPMIAIRSTGDIEVLRVPFAKPIASVTPRQDFSLAFDDLTITEPKAYSEKSNVIVKAPYEQPNGVSPEDFGGLAYDDEEGTLNDDIDTVGLCDRDSTRLGRFLAIGTVQRERCRRGYLFDCRENMEIVAGNWQLERLWEIIKRFQEQVARDGMVYGNLDLSYIGIAGLWSEVIGNSPHRRLSNSSVKPARAIVGLNATKKIPAFEGERTHFPEHRQLCLAVCGWRFTIDTLEAECQELIERGLHYQAIVQAVLHGYKHIALNLLRTLIRSKTVQNIGLGALLASDDINDEQREMCMWMAADTSDPALKALLTFLTTGDWRDVMKTNYLHLGYRLALGLKYLNDTELSGFIQSETARAVRNGDLEGILLTGLGEQSMDLFQTYITRTNDLQTAVLATAFTNPRYVHDDVRWEMWKETYFMQMQTWRAFTARAKFTVQHNQMAKTKDGSRLVATPSTEIEMRCLHCHGSIAKPDEKLLFGENGHQTVNQSRVPSAAAQPGTVCPTCGRHMPRCGICHLWLGTPNRVNAASDTADTTATNGIVSRASSSSLANGEARQQDDVIAKLLTFCLNCEHGFHADHARMWFSKWDMCPVPDCRCLCGMK